MSNQPPAAQPHTHPRPRLELNEEILHPSPSGDPLRKVLDLNPGFKWASPSGQGQIHIKEAEIQLLSHGDHRLCDGMGDVERADTRFRWHIFRLGPYEGREGVIQPMVNAMFRPDIERIQQGVEDLTNSFRDTTKICCGQCHAEFDYKLECYACGAPLATGAVFGSPDQKPEQSEAKG